MRSDALILLQSPSAQTVSVIALPAVMIRSCAYMDGVINALASKKKNKLAFTLFRFSKQKYR